MIFTGQAWNMTFSFYHSLKSVPHGPARGGHGLSLQLVAAASSWVELPFSTIGLVWNSMMSMAGGWFFLMISEAFDLGDKDFRLPGIGSYMSVAVHEKRYDAMFWAIVAMMIMIIAARSALWRPIVVWARSSASRKAGDQTVSRSWFLDWLTRSSLVALVVSGAEGLRARASSRHAPVKPNEEVRPNRRQSLDRSPGRARLLPPAPRPGVSAPGSSSTCLTR